MNESVLRETLAERAERVPDPDKVLAQVVHKVRRRRRTRILVVGMATATAAAIAIPTVVVRNHAEVPDPPAATPTATAEQAAATSFLAPPVILGRLPDGWTAFPPRLESTGSMRVVVDLTHRSGHASASLELSSLQSGWTFPDTPTAHKTAVTVNGRPATVADDDQPGTGPRVLVWQPDGRTWAQLRGYEPMAVASLVSLASHVRLDITATMTYPFRLSERPPRDAYPVGGWRASRPADRREGIVATLVYRWHDGGDWLTITVRRYPSPQNRSWNRKVGGKDAWLRDFAGAAWLTVDAFGDRQLLLEIQQVPKYLDNPKLTEAELTRIAAGVTPVGSVDDPTTWTNRPLG